MEVTKEIFIEGNLIENSTIKLYYRGKFVREYSNEVFIVYGYGPDWKETKEQKMTWIGDCFFVELKLLYNGELNFCFKNDFGSWDNNNNANYTICIKLEENKIIEKKEVVIEVKNNVEIEPRKDSRRK